MYCQAQLVLSFDSDYVAIVYGSKKAFWLSVVRSFQFDCGSLVWLQCFLHLGKNVKERKVEQESKVCCGGKKCNHVAELQEQGHEAFHTKKEHSFWDDIKNFYYQHNIGMTPGTHNRTNWPIK